MTTTVAPITIAEQAAVACQLLGVTTRVQARAVLDAAPVTLSPADFNQVLRRWPHITTYQPAATHRQQDRMRQDAQCMVERSQP